MTETERNPAQPQGSEPWSTEADDPRFVVGIGASAGGLEALTQFVAALPPNLNCAYVVIQHLSPSYKSMMASLLGRETSLQVREIEDGMHLEPDTIHVAPPRWDVVHGEGRLHLQTPLDDSTKPKPSINRFLQSLAETLGDRAVGVILSGTGSDGTLGIRDIKTYGGLTFVQTPETAKYDGMPRSAIDSGRVDRVLPPAQIAEKLAHIVELQRRINEQESVDQKDHFYAILSALHQHSGIDFHDYKKSTLRRRVNRRLAACECGDLGQYLVFLERRPEELDELGRELLISVTSFFRDREAFDALEQTLARTIAEHGDNELRIWISGCATGEEAYSIAILCSELMHKQQRRIALQLFATDIDSDALAVARRGLYPASALADLPAPLLRRYFSPRGHFLEVAKSLRDLLVFARQDMAGDPPFMRLDLISCRNVLIYMNPSLQSKVLATFHYALRNNGLLFLGRSESVSRDEGLFKAVNSKARVYRRQRTANTPLAALFKPASPRPGNLSRRPRPELDLRPPDQVLQGLLLHEYAPVAMIFDQRQHVLHIHNPHSNLLRLPSSGPVIELLQVLPGELHSEAQSLIHLCRRKNKPGFGQPRQLNERWLRLAAYPPDAAQGLTALTIEVSGARFAPPPAPSEGGDAEDSGAVDLRNELNSTREHLQTVVEELETSNEEMQALNEEVQASNEELQASNEELEASNEELQATNEELISLNEELAAKTRQLVQLSNEYEHLYNSLELPLLVLNSETRLLRVNRSAVQRFDLGPGAIGLPLSRLGLQTPLEGLPGLLQKVLQDARSVQHRVDHQERSYSLNLTPGFDESGQVNQVFVFLIDHTNMVRTERALREKRDQLQAIMDHSSSLLAVKDTTGRYRFANRRFLEFFGLEAIPEGKTDTQVFGAGAQADRFRRSDLAVLANQEPALSQETVQGAQGEAVLEVIRFALLDDSGVPYAICTQAEDVTIKEHAEEQLRLAAKVFDQSGEGISITDPKGRIITVNQAFTRVTGYPLQEVIGKSPAVLKSGRHDTDFYAQMWTILNDQGWWQGEVWNRRKNGEIYPEWLTITAVRDAQGAVTHYVGIFSDITAIKESQRRVAYLASHDELTGLANRALFNDELRHALGRAARHRNSLALLFIDLDNFKTINDTLGHETGDLLLKDVTQRLQESVREGDLVARMGGDEFVLLLEDVTPEAVRQVAERVVDFVSASYTVGPHQLFVTCSIGISFYPEDGDDSRTLLKNADAAMYRAKEAGRNQFQYVTGDMQVVAQQRLTIQTGLRSAFAQNEFKVVLQPKVRLSDGAVVAAEALLRWESAALGPVSPALFIPIAESSGLIKRIDDWVLDAVLEILAGWRREGLHAVPIAVNISPVHFRSGDLVNEIQALLKHYTVPPGLLNIELTEGALMENSNESGQNLQALRAHGVGISVDDFGTGYSSLSYLKRYPIDELKIDRDFVDGVADEESDRAITTAIIALAKALGMRVVAEGAETAEQVNALRELGCDLCQGFYFYRGLPVEEFEKLLQTETAHDRLPGPN